MSSFYHILAEKHLLCLYWSSLYHLLTVHESGVCCELKTVTALNGDMLILYCRSFTNTLWSSFQSVHYLFMQSLSCIFINHHLIILWRLFYESDVCLWLQNSNDWNCFAILVKSSLTYARMNVRWDSINMNKSPLHSPPSFNGTVSGHPPNPPQKKLQFTPI